MAPRLDLSALTLPPIPGAWLVGGAVRDLLLGRPVVDVDLVIEGDVAEAAASLGGEVVVHERFGTATVRVGGRIFDLAAARSETYAAPGALPEVRPSSLTEDLLRRDFTVNAIACSLEGEVVAAPGALEDLESRVLRVLHGDSFRDDPTRLLRMVRYATRLGFEVEPETARLADEALRSVALATVTPARVGGELRLLLREDSAVQALAWIGSWEGAWEVPLGFDAGLAEQAASLLPADARRDLLLLASAVRSVPSPRLFRWLDELEFLAPERDVVVAAAAVEPAPPLSRPSEIAARFRPLPLEAVALAGALGAAEPARRWLSELRHVRLDIDGSDLLAAGVPQGAAVGAGLAAALAAKLDGDAPDRAAQLAAALR